MDIDELEFLARCKEFFDMGCDAQEFMQKADRLKTLASLGVLPLKTRKAVSASAKALLEHLETIYS